VANGYGEFTISGQSAEPEESGSALAKMPLASQSPRNERDAKHAASFFGFFALVAECFW
jgi:hypothetical protein